MGGGHHPYQPLHFKLADRPCLVVGGGKTAERRIRALLSCGARLKVVAPEVEGNIGLMAEAGLIHLERRPFSEADLENQFLVVALTDNRSLNKRIMNLCEKKGILCTGNGIDGWGDFIFPSTLRRGEVTVSISTGGSSPTLSRWLREELDEMLPGEITRLSLILGLVRSRIHQDSVSLSYEDWRKAIDPETLAEILSGEGRAQDEIAEKIYRRLTERPVLCLWGVSHRTAPLALREKLLDLLPEEQELLGILRENLDNALFLSTCNRVEIYSFTGRARFAGVVKKILPPEMSGGEATKVTGAAYLRFGREAVEHLIRVASGLDSAAKGESQIRNQIRKAMDRASSSGCLDFPLDRILQIILRESRSINLALRGLIGTRSVSGSAIQRLLSEAGKPRLRKILVIGTGETGRDLCYRLSRLKRFELMLVGGDADRVSRIGRRFGALPLTYDLLDHALTISDAVLSASPRPGQLVSYERMYTIMENRGFRPLLIIDLSVPRDFPGECARINGVNLIDLEDLTKNDLSRRLDVELRHAVAHSTDRVMEWLEEREKAPVITSVKARAEQAWRMEKELLWQRLGLNDPKTRELIEESVKKTINRALHAPLLLLKGDGFSRASHGRGPRPANVRGDGHD